MEILVREVDVSQTSRLYVRSPDPPDNHRHGRMRGENLMWESGFMAASEFVSKHTSPWDLIPHLHLT